jgi:hypothetical protein
MKKEEQKLRFSKKMGVALIVAVALFACSKSTDTTLNNNNNNNNGGSVDCTGAAKLFSTDVNPIIQSTCATGSSCHGTGSINGPGELRTYSEIANAHAAIRSAILSGLMPKTGSLTNAQKNTIICWIDNGALNN